MGEDSGVHVIATTISGSIKDWGKVERIGPSSVNSAGTTSSCT